MAKMTKEQAVELLKNRKVYVNGKSAEIQRKLFKLGWKWTKDGPLYVINENSPFIYIYKDGGLGHSAGMRLFVENQMQEISAEEILAIEIIEESLKENDVVSCGWGGDKSRCEWFSVVKKGNPDSYNYKVSLILISGGTRGRLSFDGLATTQEWCRASTEEEKRIFIDALKASKDSQAKEILKEVFGIEKKPECPFKPFDRVLVRDGNNEKWIADFFSHYDNDDSKWPYVCSSGYWIQCIPYENNEHLVGTTNNPE